MGATPQMLDIAGATEVPHFARHAHPVARSRVGLIALHHPRPLAGTHRTGAAVGHEINDGIVRAQQKRIVVSILTRLRALRFGAHADGFPTLAPERLDDAALFHGAQTLTNLAWKKRRYFGS